MTKTSKVVICIMSWLAVTLLGGYIGSWWPVRNVPRDEIWAGDGIGIMLYGLIGLICGGMLGTIALMVFLWMNLRSKNKSPQK